MPSREVYALYYYLFSLLFILLFYMQYNPEVLHQWRK